MANILNFKIIDLNAAQNDIEDATNILEEFNKAVDDLMMMLYGHGRILSLGDDE